MILVTIGTNEQPFDRLVLAAAALEIAEPVIDNSFLLTGCI